MSISTRGRIEVKYILKYKKRSNKFEGLVELVAWRTLDGTAQRFEEEILLEEDPGR